MVFIKCFIIVLIVGIFTVNAITGPIHGKIVVCYLGSWSVYRPERGSFTIEHLEPSLCTHIIYSFAGLDVTEDSIRPLDPWQDLTENYGKGGYKRLTSLKQKYPHLKITIALGGWNEGSANYSALAKDASRREKFVGNAIQFVRKYNFDGLDLDWEFPGKRGGVPEDKQNFLLLVKELRAAFQKHNLLLTAALGAGKDTIDGAYDVEGLSVYLDFIHIMCYDYHGAWDLKTGANAPLRSSDVLNVEFTINYLLKLKAPPHKLVMGVPLYGRTFLLVEPVQSNRKPKLGTPARNIGPQGPFTRENGFMGYNEICLELKNTTAIWKSYWDDESLTPFAVLDNQLISYDNDKSVREKVRFAILEKALGGIMVWSVDTDDFHGDCADVSETGHFENYPLLRAINREIQECIEEIERNRENEIIHGKERLSGGTERINLAIFSLVSLIVAVFWF